MIADYFVLRKRRLNLAGLYDANGEYRYTGGFSLVAMFSLVLSILPNLPGFLVNIHAIPAQSVPGLFVTLYNYAWFVGFIVAFTVYLGLRWAGGGGPLAVDLASRGE